RFSGYLKAAYNFSEFTSLTLIGTGYTRDKGTFTYWKGLNDALLPPDDEIGQLTPSDRYMVGLLFKHMFNQDISMLIKPSLYSSYWRDDSESSNSSKSNLYRTEVQINFKLSEKSLLISGIEGQHNIVVSSIFGDRLSNGLGLYAQWEYRLLESLRLSVGARFDYLKLDSLNGEGDVSPKIGLNYEMNDATILRASAGKGFRMPTLAEAFTSTTTSGISVKPNPDLKSETVYSFEIGGNHKFTEEFFIDLALFDNEYYDLIEPGIDPADGKIVFENVTRARVAGLELAGTLSFLSNDLTVKAGYTYLNTEDSSTGKELKYRPKHSLVVTVDYTAGLFLCGADFRYSSRVEEIDDELVDFGLVPDGDERVDIIVLDLRAGANLLINKLPLRIFLNLNNILNYNYVEMMGNLSPIRNYVLSVDFLF
ncbi:MAG: TonB-dependent receptor, partial [Melioribacteraceae bacterium]|nr:TonB-dependent receptor [Melioribacteraceae bacterium]